MYIKILFFYNKINDGILFYLFIFNFYVYLIIFTNTVPFNNPTQFISLKNS